MTIEKKTPDAELTIEIVDSWAFSLALGVIAAALATIYIIVRNDDTLRELIETAYEAGYVPTLRKRRLEV